MLFDFKYICEQLSTMTKEEHSGSLSGNAKHLDKKKKQEKRNQANYSSYEVKLSGLWTYRYQTTF